MLPLYAPKAPGVTAWIGLEEDVNLLLTVVSQRLVLKFLCISFICMLESLESGPLKLNLDRQVARLLEPSNLHQALSRATGPAVPEKLPAANLHYLMRANYPRWEEHALPCPRTIDCRFSALPK